MKILRITTTIYIITILVTACGGSPVEDVSLEGTTWVLTAYNKNRPLEGTQPTIHFEDGQVSGNASCNSYGGSYEVQGDKIGFSALFMTEMYCMDPEGVMDQETLYLEMLGKAVTYEINSGVLTIVIGPQQTLTFERQ